jgi:hypothetical protein
MTKINGAELIEVDTLGGMAAANGGRRSKNRIPSFLDIRLAAAAALKRMGLPQSEHGDFRQQTRREAIAHRRCVHRSVAKIKRTDLSRAKRNSSLVTRHSSLSK